MKGPPTASSIPGCEAETCTECGCEIHIAPSGRLIQQRHLDEEGIELRLVCNECGMKLFEQDENPEIHPIQPEQAREISAEKLMDFWRRVGRQ